MKPVVHGVAGSAVGDAVAVAIGLVSSPGLNAVAALARIAARSSARGVQALHDLARLGIVAISLALPGGIVLGTMVGGVVLVLGQTQILGAALALAFVIWLGGLLLAARWVIEADRRLDAVLDPESNR